MTNFSLFFNCLGYIIVPDKISIERYHLSSVRFDAMSKHCGIISSNSIKPFFILVQNFINTFSLENKQNPISAYTFSSKYLHENSISFYTPSKFQDIIVQHVPDNEILNVDILSQLSRPGLRLTTLVLYSL